MKAATRFVVSLAGAAIAAVVFHFASVRVDAHKKTQAPQVAQAAEHRAEGAVTGVLDGDTIVVMVDGKQLKVRLAGIDAPEKAQAWGRKSEKTLRALVDKRRVRLEWRESDRYGRVIAKVWVDGLDVNAEQVKQGSAWVYRQYTNDAALIALEDGAKSARKGLWSQGEPTPPWVWRRASEAK